MRPGMRLFLLLPGFGCVQRRQDGLHRQAFRGDQLRALAAQRSCQRRGPVVFDHQQTSGTVGSYQLAGLRKILLVEQTGRSAFEHGRIWPQLREGNPAHAAVSLFFDERQVQDTNDATIHKLDQHAEAIAGCLLLWEFHAVEVDRSHLVDWADATELIGVSLATYGHTFLLTVRFERPAPSQPPDLRHRGDEPAWRLPWPAREWPRRQGRRSTGSHSATSSPGSSGTDRSQ